jgi:hypothetical protein
MEFSVGEWPMATGPKEARGTFSAPPLAFLHEDNVVELAPGGVEGPEGPEAESSELSAAS